MDELGGKAYWSLLLCLGKRKPSWFDMIIIDKLLYIRKGILSVIEDFRQEDARLLILDQVNISGWLRMICCVRKR